MVAFFPASVSTTLLLTVLSLPSPLCSTPSHVNVTGKQEGVLSNDLNIGLFYKFDRGTCRILYVRFMALMKERCGHRNWIKTTNMAWRLCIVTGDEICRTGCDSRIYRTSLYAFPRHVLCTFWERTSMKDGISGQPREARRFWFSYWLYFRVIAITVPQVISKATVRLALFYGLRIQKYK